MLDTSTIRPRPAARIAGSSSRVSRTGPKKLVEKHLLPRRLGHLLEAADAGDPGVVHDPVRGADALEDLRRRRGDRRRGRRSRAGRRRAGRRRSPAPVRARSRSSPSSGARIAATTVQPSRCRWAAVASPSPRDAPVTTTLRASATRGSQRPPSAGGSTSADRRAGRVMNSDQMPGKYGPGCPPPRRSAAGRTPSPRGTGTGRPPRSPPRTLGSGRSRRRRGRSRRR